MRYKIAMRVLDAQEAFFLARRPRKDSPHTTAAYRRDLAGISALLAEVVGAPVEQLGVDQLTVGALRAAFGLFADGHAKSSVLRAWSTWNQFLTFCVSEEILPGNPMGAVDRPKAPALSPKPLRGEDTPEQLLAAAAEGSRQARDPWPERDVLVIALGLVAGLRSAEMRSLVVGSLVGRSGERRLHVAGKGSRERSIPVEPAMERVIEGYLESCRRRFPQGRFGRSAPLLRDRRGEPIGRGALEYLVRSCYRWAGLHDRVPAGANLHALRHTFATRLAEDGASASEIMALLGHASLATTQSYIEATARERRAAAASNRTYRKLGEVVVPAPPD
ncbi:tyrosine-type recombinase/integrase [Goodfellowiella coeruleoviolacea]|uniref:Site-specific recombinase XerD n=1 Tax=Goodfellowiella coeruleoviolacea TaxID=334858 RepID=A0AAE3KIM5_9PSEU|nr:tyrosine-type recombinase/integrase [Goodfellowiella coeruleoviolacea]MCP2167554.1 Site-specific recombinase XerD [Goodfellowiella coeruleoviolacea]